MNLEKMNPFFPNFQMEDFSMFDTITQFKWETVFDCILGEERKILSMIMTSFNHYQIQMEFVDVNFLRFCGNGQISGFYIQDMSTRGYEIISKYKIGDYELDEIEFYCSDIIIKSIEHIKT